MYYLREITRNDLQFINEWRNDEELISFLGAPFRFIDMEVDNKWFDSYMSNRNNSVRCAIVESDTNTIIGMVNLLNIDYINRTCVIGIMIGKNEKRGRGAGEYALRKMIEHAFFNMNMNRVELLVLSDNLRAQGLYRKIGFKKEGVKRSCVFKNGSYKDMIIMGLLNSEYER